MSDPTPEPANQPPVQPPVQPVQNAGPTPPPQVPTTLAYVNAQPAFYVPTKDEKTMAMLVWLLSLLVGWIGVLIIWLLKKDESRFVDFHGKQALYLHVGLFIAIIILYITCIGILLIPPLLIAVLIFSIMACVKANNGEWYRCPLISWVIRV